MCIVIRIAVVGASLGKDGAFGIREGVTTGIEPPLQRKRVLVALYGLQNRDRGCAWPSQQRNVVDVLEGGGFAVDIFRYELLPPDGSNVDEIRWHPPSPRLPADFYRNNTYAQADKAVDAMCANIQCTYRLWGSYSRPSVVTNAKRQLYTEWQVGRYLQAHAGRYDAAVALGSDIYVPRKISLFDIATAVNVSKNASVFTTRNNDAGGYTNGFYLGGAQVLTRVLMRFAEPGNFPEPSDYEHQLLRSFQRNGIVRRPLFNFEGIYTSFAKLRHSRGGYWPDKHMDEEAAQIWLKTFDELTRECMWSVELDDDELV